MSITKGLDTSVINICFFSFFSFFMLLFTNAMLTNVTDDQKLQQQQPRANGQCSRSYSLMYIMMNNVDYFVNPGMCSSPAPPCCALHCSLIDCGGDSDI